MKSSLSLLFILLFEFTAHCQLLYYSDLIKGGVTGVGFASGNGGTMSGSVAIPEDSSIKKVFFIAATDSTPPPITVILNGIEYTFNDSHIIVEGFTSIVTQTLNKSNSSIRIMDITSDISPSTINYSLIIPTQPNSIFTFYSHFYLLIIFENDNLTITNYDIFLNIQNVHPITNYVLMPSSNINRNNSFALGLLTSHFCNTTFDGSFVFVNNNNIGLIGGNYINSNNLGCGVMSNFSYFNNTLYGLDNDTPDNIMGETDALADIINYLNPSNDSLEITFQYQSGTNNAGAYTNPIRCIFLTYTSPCQPFEASLLASDTATCLNSPVQLGVSVPDTINATYEWLPQTNLSCYDCPNPVFLGDSTINYTVRIWASDSCSKVLPVRVRVLPNPIFESIGLTESVCGGATGSIAVASSGLSQPHTFQINNGTPQNNGTFNNLAAGAATVTVSNADGCSVDSTIVIGEFNNVVAAFSVNPLTGAAPLDVSITNQSQNATEYFWDFTDEDGNLLNQVTGHFGSAQCPEAGVYKLTLVAGNGAPHCNDTTSVLIVVKEPFVVFAYTHVTNEADVYQVFFSGVSEYDYKIYALDGKLVYKKSGSIESAGHVDLWEISKFSSGMYVFRIKVKDSDGNEHEVDGKVVVVK